MASLVFGDVLYTADFSGSPAKWQVIVPGQNLLLKAVRSYFIFYGNPTFTTITFRLYSFKNSTPYSLLYTSDDNISKADLISATYGVKEGYWAFTKPPMLVAGDSYALVPWISGYTYVEASHVSWRKLMPREIYDHAEDIVGYSDVGIAPFDLSMVVSPV